MQLLEIDGWRLWFDAQATREAYARIERGAPEECKCGDCIAFSQNRDTFYKGELFDLLTLLGIDYRKEAEVYNSGPGTPICGWFFFVGKIESGDDIWRYLSDNFQVEVGSGCRLRHSEFEGLDTVKLEWICHTERVHVHDQRKPD